MKILKETEDTRYIFRNGLNKACFQHDMAYGDFNPIWHGIFFELQKHKWVGVGGFLAPCPS